MNNNKYVSFFMFSIRKLNKYALYLTVAAALLGRPTPLLNLLIALRSLTEYDLVTITLFCSSGVSQISQLYNITQNTICLMIILVQLS